MPELAGNATTEQRLVYECDRLVARLVRADDEDAAGGRHPSRDELIASYIAGKMQRFDVTDAQLRHTISTVLRRRFDDMMTCCQEVPFS